MKLSSSESLRRVLRHLKPYTVWIVLALLCAAGNVAAALYIPILVGKAVDAIVGPGQVVFTAVASIGLEIAVLALLGAAAQWVMNVVNNRIVFCVTRDTRAEAFAHLQKLPLSYLDSHPSGDVISRMIADVDQFADGLLMGFTQLFTGVLTILGTLGIMFYLNWKITLVVVVLTPLSLFAAKFIASRTYNMFREQSQSRGEQTAFLNEMVDGQKVVQAFGYEPRAEARFGALNEALRKASLRATFFSSLTNPVTRFVTSVVYASVCLAGAMSAVAGAITVGGLTVFLSYANQYAKPFNEISGVVTELQNAVACAGRVFALMDEPEQIPDAPDAETLTDVTGRVALEHVAFRYVPQTPLLEDVNLDVRPGERVAIVGPTGCGKTTLINLLMRFYDVNGGAITVDGHDVRGVTRDSLRQNFGMVLQDTWLKTGTVRENIALARPDATEDEIEAAAKAAHAHGFITRLPQGYDTPLTDTSAGLSAGQRQLLCIARLMLALPPMLILDEATSSIDTRTELKIQQAFAAMMQGRTSFIVAHRLSTIREADVILVMQNGHIIEQGRHDELLRQNGFYAKLYNSQFAP